MKHNWRPGTMIYPLPDVIVSCGSTTEEYNLLKVSWTGTICSDPATSYISVRQSQHSDPILKKNMVVVITRTAKDRA